MGARRQGDRDEGKLIARLRLKDKTAIIVGAGQSPGSGMGNSRATALRFAQEGASVMAVDRELGLAEAGKSSPCATNGSALPTEVREE